MRTSFACGGRGHSFGTAPTLGRCRNWWAFCMPSAARGTRRSSQTSSLRAARILEFEADGRLSSEQHKGYRPGEVWPGRVASGFGKGQRLLWRQSLVLLVRGGTDHVGGVRRNEKERKKGR